MNERRMRVVRRAVVWALAAVACCPQPVFGAESRPSTGARVPAAAALPAGSGRQAESSDRPAVALLEQLAPTAAEPVFHLRLAVSGLGQIADPTALEVAATMFQRLPSRTQLASAIAGRGLSSVRSFVAQRLPTPALWVPGANLDSSGRLLVGLDLQVDRSARGTHPVRVELRMADGSNVFDTFTTFVSARATSVPTPLDVAVILPLRHRSPEREGQGIGTLASPLETVVDRVLAHPGTPVTLLPSPGTMDDIAPRDPGLLERLRLATAGREVLGGPFVPVAPELAEDPALADELRRSAIEGPQTLRRTLGVNPTMGTLVVEPGDPIPSRTVLELLGTQRVVLPERSLASGRSVPVGSLLTYDPGAAERVDTPALPLLTLDERLAGHLLEASVSRTKVLRVEHLLADLSLIYQEDPDRARAVPIVVPDAVITSAALDELLRGVAADPRLRLVTLEQAFARPAAVDRAGDLVVRRLPGTVSEPVVAPVNVSDLLLVRNRLEGYRSMLAGSSATTPATADGNTTDGNTTDGNTTDGNTTDGNTTDSADSAAADDPEVAVLNRSLLRLLDRSLSPESRRARLLETAQHVDSLLGKVRLVPGSFVLTARRGEIHVTFASELERRIRVQMTVQSDRVEIADPVVFNLEIGPGTTTQFFGVETREPGRFQILVTVRAPSGLELFQESYSLRSSAASWVGQALTGGALAVLGLWWTRSIIRSRREKARHRHPAASQPHAAP